jgi:8-oxo-dGTP pyrophosphatase MutT (NUDIX family)
MINNNIHVLSRAVIIDQDHILLCKTTDLANNFYYLPGGHVEYKESVEESLARELIEEAGVEVIIKRFLGCLEYRFTNKHHCHDHEYNFLFEVESDHLKLDIKPTPCESKMDIIWMPLKTLVEIDFRAEPLKRLIPKWLSEPENNCFRSDSF